VIYTDSNYGGDKESRISVTGYYGGDKESRISVTGYIVYLLGVPICWRSKSQRSVSLSSSEEEFISLSIV
jgi:hypothetical protein